MLREPRSKLFLASSSLLTQQCLLIARWDQPITMRRTTSSSFATFSCQRFRLSSLKRSHGYALATSLSTPQPLSPIHNDPSSTPQSSHNISHSTSSTVQVGTTYEQLCLRVLSRLSFSLTRTGGKSDKGIDLLGLWRPPVPSPSNSPLRVVTQCKAYTGQVYPALIRELEGTVGGAPGEWRKEDTIGVLCAAKGATSGVRDAMRVAERGIIWVTVEKGRIGGSRAEGKVTQLLWNERVRKLVENGLGAGLRYVPGAERMEQEVVLMLNGRIWEPEYNVDSDGKHGVDPVEGHSSVERSDR